MPKEQLITLIDKYLDESIQLDEHARLAILLEEPKHIEQFKSIIFQELCNRRLELEPDEQIGITIRQYVQQRMNEISNPGENKPAHRIHFLKTSWFRYAAAVILILGVAAYIWLAEHPGPAPVVATQAGHGQNTSITPGQNRAILTLANGRQIILDSTQGNIVNQGRLRVVNFAGKLQYEGIGTPTEYNTITTPKGSQYQIVLPDGSKVWLNTASSIKFPTAFSEKERTIEITGEVYLEVSPEARSAKKRLPPFLKGDSREAAGGYAARQPFIVSINNGTQIQVLGTSFNINAYPDETSIKTTLIEGSVKIISNTGANGKQASLILKPGQQATVLPPNLAKENKVITILPADIEQTLAWKNGTFQLAHTTLAETMRQLARWYDIEVVYEKGVPDIKLDGDVKRNLTLPQMLDVLNSLGVKLRMEGRRMIVLR